jgi:hypothetical protein
MNEDLDVETALRLLRAQRLKHSSLFLAGNAIYVSKDAGNFRGNSKYRRLPDALLPHEQLLISLTAKLEIPEYSSLEVVEADIKQYRDWERLYKRLLRVLGKHGANDAFGYGDYFLIDDYYCSTQHKVEYAKPEFLTDAIVTDVQRALLPYAEDWEVIFAPDDGSTVTRVFKNRRELV